MEPPSVTKSSPYAKTRVDSLIGSGSYSKLFPYSYNETIQIQRPYNISVPKTLLDGSGALSLGALITQLVNYKFNIVLDSKQSVNQETLNLLPRIHGFYFRVLPTERLYRLKHQTTQLYLLMKQMFLPKHLKLFQLQTTLPTMSQMTY